MVLPLACIDPDCIIVLSDPYGYLMPCCRTGVSMHVSMHMHVSGMRLFDCNPSASDQGICVNALGIVLPHLMDYGITACNILFV